MNDLTTKDLTEELIKREGISDLVVEPHKEVTITTGEESKVITGPAIIVINQD